MLCLIPHYQKPFFHEGPLYFDMEHVTHSRKDSQLFLLDYHTPPKNIVPKD